MKYRIHLTAEVRDFLQSLAPEPRRRLKLAIISLAVARGDVCALRERLSGYYRLKVGGHRVIYRYRANGVIECVFAQERSLVYHLFEREMLERLRKQDDAGSRIEESVAKYISDSRKSRNAATRRRTTQAKS